MDEEPVAVTEATPVVVPPGDAVNRVLSWGAIAIALIAIAELVGIVTVGLGVKVSRMNFPNRQGYAFLTILEKSPIGIALIVASVLGAIALVRKRDGDVTNVTTIALWVVVVAAALLGIGTILAVMARFRVGQLVENQRVDTLTRRILVVFVIRNFGSAVAAALIAVGALFRPSVD